MKKPINKKIIRKHMVLLL